MTEDVSLRVSPTDEHQSLSLGVAEAQTLSAHLSVSVTLSHCLVWPAQHGCSYSLVPVASGQEEHKEGKSLQGRTGGVKPETPGTSPRGRPEQNCARVVRKEKVVGRALNRG